MRRRNNEPDIRVALDWKAARKDVGHVKKGDLVMDLVVYDEEKKTDAQLVFIEGRDIWKTFSRTKISLLRMRRYLRKSFRFTSKVVQLGEIL